MTLIRRSALDVAGRTYPVRIHVEQRANAVVSIGKRTITIRFPRSMTREEMSRETLSMMSWARRKISEAPTRFAPTPAKVYTNGDELKMGQDTFVLHIEHGDKGSSSARLVGHQIRLSISSRLPLETQQRHITSLLSRCVARRRLPSLQRRLEELNSTHFQQKIGTISFRHSRSRWGSCSTAGNITLSTGISGRRSAPL